MDEILGDAAFRSRDLIGRHYEVPYAGATSFLRTRYSRDLKDIDVAVLGVPLDLATSNRPGTRFGPRGVRQASAQIAWGPQHPWTFDPRDRLAIVDYGDVLFDYGYIDRMLAETERMAREIIDSGTSLLAIGGDHFISLPLLRAHAKRHGKLSLVHFDAHSDTWADDLYNHGTMFYHAMNEGLIDPARSIQIGLRTYNPQTHGFTILDNAAVIGNGAAWVAEQVRRVVGDGKAYLTFDIDCLDPSFAPGTGTPVCGGLSTFQAFDILVRLDWVNFIGMDIVEVAPIYDVGEITSLAGAAIAMHYLSLRAKNLPHRSNVKIRREA
ncbi:MAG: agmatinase [Alphaproteobacteria bacterium]|nr:agmatinase [Alphaproteobacteria bacterium]